MPSTRLSHPKQYTLTTLESRPRNARDPTQALGYTASTSPSHKGSNAQLLLPIELTKKLPTPASLGATQEAIKVRILQDSNTGGGMARCGGSRNIARISYPVAGLQAPTLVSPGTGPPVYCFSPRDCFHLATRSAACS